MGDRYEVVIAGAGHGGAHAAMALRQAKFAGTIAIVGEEPEMPYERPPLSKDFLSGERPFERLLIRPVEFWAGKDITLLTGRAVTSIDPEAHRLALSGGSTLNYGTLVWAAGGIPRRLSCAGHHFAGVHTMRTKSDVDRMRHELPSATHIVIVGGGFVGLEAAATLTRLGKHVTVLEALDRVLARVAGEPLSRFYEAEHRAQGVEIRLNARVERIEGEKDRVSGVRLASGDILRAEMVIVGIGIVPAVEPLLAAGAHGGNGVAVDAHCRTSLADIFAIGDCALHANAFADGANVRLESVQNATDQANVVAQYISGRPSPYSTVPWFWSNQYDLRLQTVGLSIGHDQVVVRGEISSRRFSLVYLKAGRVVALDCVNAAMDFLQGKSVVAERMALDPVSLADSATPLKSLAEAARHAQQASVEGAMSV